MRRFSWMKAVLFSTFAALAACGGGGGGGTSGGGSGLVPGSTPTPTATASPTPAPVHVAVAGRVVDENGNGIAGATVSFGTAFALVPGGMITGVVATTVTDATGAFGASIVTGAASYVQVDAAGRASAHKAVATTSNVTLASWTLPAPSADESAALVALNADRASGGSGAGAQPLTWDADMLLVARYRAAHMAALGFFAHTAPGATMADSDVEWASLPNSLYPAPGSTPTLVGQENIAYGFVSLIGAESAFFNNDAASLQGHHNNIVSRGNIWIGIAESFGGLPFVGATNTSGNYFSENFETTCAAPCP